MGDMRKVERSRAQQRMNTGKMGKLQSRGRASKYQKVQIKFLLTQMAEPMFQGIFWRRS